MARNRNVVNNNFNDPYYSEAASSDIERVHQAETKAIKKEADKKVHVSVLLNHEDFEYLRDVCFRNRISKNEFFKGLLNEYRNMH